jgi:5'-phosphate synthase pdxT subunit
MPGRVGVLALQGDAPEHLETLRQILGADRVREVRTPETLADVEALFLPGGESTTLSRLLDEARLREPLTARISQGFPVFATCAGIILLARDLERSPGGRDPTPLGVLDVKVRRNDYGRQSESFEASLAIEGVAGGDFPGVFIRAPRIVEVGPKASTLARWKDSPVLVRQGGLWGLTFHPELSGDLRLHEAFLRSIGQIP